MRKKFSLIGKFDRTWTKGDSPESLFDLSGFSATQANSEIEISYYDEHTIRAFQHGKDLSPLEQIRTGNAIRQRVSRERKKENKLRQSFAPSAFRNGSPIDSHVQQKLQEIDVHDAVARIPEKPIELRIIAEFHLLYEIPLKDLAHRFNISVSTLNRRRAIVKKMLQRALIEYSQYYRE